MGLQKFRNLFAAAALGLVAACASTDLRIVENDEHPFPESMFATLSGMAFPSRTPEFKQSLKIFKVAVKGFRRSLPVWYWKRVDAKMTFVLLSGYGGSPDSNVLQAIAELLWEQGFSVLSVPSSTHPDFSQAASAKRLPGHSPRDLAELGAALDDVRAILSQRQPELLTTRWALAGLSYGALQTLHEALGAKPSSKLNFEAFIAFNPPVRLSYAMQRLDESFESGADTYLLPNGQLDAAMSSKVQAAQNQKLYWSETLAAFNQDELEFLLAWEFRKSLLLAISWPNPNPRSLSFGTYLQTQLFASLTPPLNLQQWSELQDLRLSENVDDLRKYSRSVLVFHSLNDPLCAESDVLWLKTKLGPQMQLYRQGGHLGYVWSQRFRSDLKTSLAPLRQDVTRSESPPNQSPSD